MDLRAAATLALLPIAVPSAVAAETLAPYQETQLVNSGKCLSHQCILKFATVPAGKRLVVTTVSAQLGSVSQMVILEGSSATLFVPKPYADASVLTVPVTFYYGPNATPTARVFAGGANSTIIVTLVGNVVAAQ